MRYLLQASNRRRGKPVAGQLVSAVEPNGFDIVAESTDSTTGDYAVKIGGVAATVNRVWPVSATETKLRIDTRILTGDSVTVADSSSGDSAATNNSDQTSTTVTHQRFTWTFASAPTVGILAAGDPTVTTAVNVTAVAYNAASGEEQYTIHGSQLNPIVATAFSQSTHPFHPSATNYSAGTAVSYPLSLSEDDCLMASVGFPVLDTHATSTAFSVGDTIEESGRYWRCATAGTTTGSKPSFSSGSNTVSDGSVLWTRGAFDGDEGRSLVRRVAVLHCSGASLKSQDTFRCSFAENATKRYYTWSDVNLSLLPSEALPSEPSGFTASVPDDVWWEVGYGNGGGESESIPEAYMPAYGYSMQSQVTKNCLYLFSDASYKTEMATAIIQRGIDYIGMREDGLYIEGNGGWGHGRVLMQLVAMALLEDEATLLSVVRGHANGNWRGTEFREQLFYLTQTDLDRQNNADQYSSNGGSGDFINPANTPSTYGDSPSNAYFPASVQETWLHVPEWGLRAQSNPLRNTPTWSINTAENNYRDVTTAQNYGGLAYICMALGLVDSIDQGHFFDYMDRYVLVADAGGGAWDYPLLYANFYQVDRDAFAFTATRIDASTVDLVFNRYATSTDSDWLTDLSCSGSVTLSSPNQTGPRTWRFTTSADCSGETMTYTSGNATDAGNSALPTQARAIS